jgi:hypothetical protein
MCQPATAIPSLEEIKFKPLSAASCQEIQLELIRRRRFNAFDGERVAATLWAHRDLWEAVMMDRLAISNPGHLPALGMRKLRDLPQDDWNVDTLYILTRNRANADRLAKIFNPRDWGGMVDVHVDHDDVDSALGGALPKQSVVSIWWD